MNRAHSLWLFTNRNSMVFDCNGQQIVEYQVAIGCYAIAPELALQACSEAEVFVLSRWGEWEQPITRTEMQYLLGLRTPAMDLTDNEAKAKP